MPFNVTRSATFYDIEVLKYPMLNLVVKSAVLDANFVTLNTGLDQRTVVPAGTILAVSATNSKTVVPYGGTGTIFGILSHSTDIIATSNLTAAQEAVPVLFHEAIFATSKIVSFTAYASALAAALPTCKFE
jgi:hypothetical protein